MNLNDGHAANLPLVSIGIPTYNRALRLKRAVESVLIQDYPNIEIVISDNASNDETQDICKTFDEQNKQIKYVRQPVNRGMSANFKEVLQSAQGDYFMWMGDDDWLSPYYISECMKVLLEHPDYSLVCGKAKYFLKDDALLCEGNQITLLHNSKKDRVVNYYSQVADNGTILGIMRRSQLCQISVPNTMGADWLLVASIAFMGKIKTLENVTINRLHKDLSELKDACEKGAERDGLPSFQGTYPHLSVAISAFNDIAWVSSIYDSLTTAERVILAYIIRKIICQRYKVEVSDTLFLFLTCLDRYEKDKMSKTTLAEIDKFKKQIMHSPLNPVEAQLLALYQSDIKDSSCFSCELPIHFFTIVLNGEPFIRHHIEIFRQLPFKWHWHIIEGVADLKHDTGWSLQFGGKITDELHRNGLSNDGTTGYLNELAKQFPEDITIYRKPDGKFWDGKLEMVNAPLASIQEECLLWQVDADELWTVDQIIRARQMFLTYPQRSAAYYWCWFFVGEGLVISTRNCYAENPAYEWLRTWRYRPGHRWIAHEPPRLAEIAEGGQWRDVALTNPFRHGETEAEGLVFQHFAYVTPKQLRFKELYYGYSDAVQNWQRLQSNLQFPALLRNYFPWVHDNTLVDRASTLGIQPLSSKHQTLSKIVVDGVIFQLQEGREGGISRVWHSLLTQLSRSALADRIVLLDRGGTAPDIPDITKVSVSKYDFNSPAEDSKILDSLCADLAADLFISTYYSWTNLYPTIIMLYDMVPERLKWDLSNPEWKSKQMAIAKALYFLSISNSTLEDFKMIYPNEARKRISVIPLAASNSFCLHDDEAVKSFKDRFSISKPYFLIVGQPWPHKNLILFFKAFSRLPNKDQYEIVVSGGRGRLQREFCQYLDSIICHEHFFTDSDLSIAYSGAIALVYPSLYEGFGLPPLEAMQSGCPVITCRNSSIPEVVGDAALYVGESDVEGMMKALIDVQKTKVRSKIIKHGKKRAKLFTWEKSGVTLAEEIAKIQQDFDVAPKIFKELQFDLHNSSDLEMISAYEDFLITYPSFALAHNDLATLCIQTRDFEKSLQHYESAVKIQPGNTTFLKNLADFYYIVQKDAQKALQMYIKGLSINPRDTEILMTLGKITIENGQLESSGDFFKKVLEIDPANEDACKILDLLGQNQAIKPKKDYLVSAIVSAYNSERFIRGCIEDLEAQTIADRLEIVIVDSCSPQNERAIVEEYQKRYNNIKYIRTDKRETVYAAWNRGIKAASGKYITNANTDDRHRRDAFEVMAEELERKPEIALVYADLIMTENENETFDRHTPCGYFQWLDWDRKMLLEKGCFMGPQPMWRRSVHDEYGYFDETMVTSGDYEFWLRISQTHNFYHIRESLGLYLKSPQSIEHRNREKQSTENHQILSLYQAAAQKGRVIKSDAARERFSLIRPKFIEGMTSIIILTQNHLEQTKKCVKSIWKHTPEDYEIIFVDNNSTDGTVKWLHSHVKESNNYHLIENKENLGLATGRNQGISLSQGEFILLLDNDVVVSENWLSGMRECLQFAPEAGIVGPMTNNISGPQQINDDKYRSVDDLDNYAAKFREQCCHRRIPLRSIAGFCMLFKRSLSEQIGLMDESFGAGNCEDDDFCLRAALAGHKNYIVGDVFIHHFENRSFIGNKIDDGAVRHDNRIIFNKKWTRGISDPEGRKLAVLKTMDFADYLYSKGDTDQAVEALINCIKLTPDAKEIYYNLAQIFIESKRFSEAQEVIDSMPEAAKDEIKGLELAAYTREGSGLDDEAASCLDKMLALDGNYPAALNLQGVLAYKKGEKEKAQEYLKKAIDTDPGYGEAYTNLGVLCWGMDQKEEALAYLKKGFILSPTVPDISNLYYSVVSSLGWFPEAEADFREASRLHPTNKNLAFFHIDTLIQQGKFESALLRIEDALAAFGLNKGTLNAALDVREKIGPLQIEKTSTKGTLSLCMIVKNEEKFLVQCLRSVRDIVNEIIIVDTGSTDQTVAIAKVFGAKVFDFPWTGDFSAARNHSLKQATGHWILILDADEVISPLDFKEIKKIIHGKSSSPAAYSITTRNYIRNAGTIGWTKNRGEYPEEAGSGWAQSTKVRLFKRSKDIYFTNPVHEILEPSLQNAKIPFYASKIVIHHYGKLNERRELTKGEEYYLLGKIKYESDPTNIKYISELAKQADVLGKYEEAVDLWKKLIPIVKANPDSPDCRDIVHSTQGDPLSEIYIQLALAYLLLDRYDEALDASRKAMAGKIKFKEYIRISAHCEMIAGSLDKAFFELEELLKAEPDYPPALLIMASVCCVMGQKERAQEILKALLDSGAQLSNLFNIIARQFHTYGKKEEALLILGALFENNLSDEDTSKLFDEYRKG